MNQLVVISGCSGGGKSTLLAELGRRGYPVVEEPGRRVVSAELAHGGTALPWSDVAGFLSQVIGLALDDLDKWHSSPVPVFFDRGLVDALVALENMTEEVAGEAWIRRAKCYSRRVFMLPPWPEIYVQDRERRHDLGEATAEYERLVSAYPAFGYDLQFVPKLAVAQRADFVLEQLNSSA